MNKVLLLQLPIQKLNFGMRCGNIPMGAAALKTSCNIKSDFIEILDEKISTYLGDRALLDMILNIKPDYIGLTVFNWNLERSKYLSDEIKKEYSPVIIFGGPEITKDNTNLNSSSVDYYVYGEGEERFAEIIGVNKTDFIGFEDSIDPYIEGLIDYNLNGTMLLETMRGCPYRCGYCYYNKSRTKLSFRNEERILKSIRWAVENDVSELYLLDPSLNVRPDLKKLLNKIALINSDKSVSINSEIRADKISEMDAELFNKSGFNGFETGLQTTNKKALKIMNRKTDLDRFVKGINYLKERDIVPRIDLILGLPGDTYEGFQESILFIDKNEMNEDIQVFPLSVLPGTDFRRNSEKLGLNYEKEPPYTVINTETFSRDEMLLAIDNTETLFDMALFPLPDLNLTLNNEKPFENHVFVSINDENYINKLVINRKYNKDELLTLAEKLTNPYQIIFTDKIKSIDLICDLVKTVSFQNPFTPFEIVFFEPDYFVDTDKILDSVCLRRPQFLDNDLRLQYNKSGNRSVQFTVVSSKKDIFFAGEMKRQVFWWKSNNLPQRRDLDELEEFDGIFIDSSNQNTEKWIDENAEYADDNIFVSFISHIDQINFLTKTSDDYYFDILPK